MKYFLIILFSLVAGTLFSFYATRSGEALYGIAAITVNPVGFKTVNEKEVTVLLNDTVFIYFIDDVFVYKLSPTVNYNTGEKVFGTERYFLYRKGQENGIRFESISDRTEGKKFQADSFIIKYGKKGWAFNYPSDTAKTKYVKLTENTAEGKLEKYIFEQVPGHYEPDTVFYYFSNLFPAINYSMSRTLDSISKMKLTKLRLLFLDRISSHDGSIEPAYEWAFEILPIKMPPPTEIFGLYEHFKKISP